MRKIYKYMPFRSDFFENYCLRGSQRGVLNDPFELSPAQELVDKFLRNGLEDNFFEEVEQFSSDSSFNEVGVISFTENYNNLLMWSHYAAEHKGIVVEFDYEKLSLYLDYKFSSKSSIERVLYNRERFSPIQNELCVKDMLLTKSDDWIYEKEHRVLPRLTKSDYVKVDKQLFEQLHEFYDDEYRDLFDVVSETENTIMFTLNEGYVEFLDNPDVDGRSTDDREEMRFSPSQTIINEIYGSLAIIPSSIFLFELPHQCISAIYMGCRTTDDDLKEINALLGNKRIPIYKAELSATHFSLDFIETYV